MAASSKVGGYECEFIDPVSEEFFVCQTCNHVARDPSLTSCCGETFCQACIAQVLEDKKPCPDCKTVEFTTFPNAKIQRKILALQVHCATKDRGCEWTGKLEGLDAHLDVDTGDCQYVDVPCPDCDQQVQKRQLATHRTDACPKRYYNCRYCGFSGTYEVVCNNHWPECEQYPIPCPNYCGLGAIERCTLEDHLPLCPMQEVECDFAHAGCTEKFLRQDLERHMEENTQKHLVLMSAATLRISQEFEKKLQEQSNSLQEQQEKNNEKVQDKLHQQREEFQESLRQKEQEIGELKQQLQEKDKEFHRQLQEKDQQIRETEAKLTRLQQYVGFSFHFTIPDFSWMVVLGTTKDSPSMYTHFCGYKICLKVQANERASGKSIHMSADLYTERGEFDDQLPWPARCTVTLELLNQHRDQDHVAVTKEFLLKRTTVGKKYVGHFSYTFIAYNDLGWNADKQTQYLKDDCLHFRVTRVELKNE